MRNGHRVGLHWPGAFTRYHLYSSARATTTRIGDFEGSRGHCYNQDVPHASGKELCHSVSESRYNRREANDPRSPRQAGRISKRGQVAQVVERSPEKAGVGGSTPSLATIILKDLAEIWRPEAGRITHGRSPKATG